MEAKFVSVIIPVYNGEKYIRHAIESVLSQTYSNFELIVVDDGSTDDSREIARSFGNKLHHICQENRGLGGARNTGILSSKAEFVGLLDADDEWMPNYLEQMMALEQQYSEAVVYYCSARGMDSNGNNLSQIFGQVRSSYKIGQRLLRANFIIPSTVILRRPAIVGIGLFEENNRDLHGCEDWDLWLRLFPSHQFVGTTETLVRYRLHENTFSANPDHMQKAVRAVIEKNFGLDDGNYAEWAEEKKRAYGGVYRYHALTSIQRLQDWDAGSKYLYKAFEVDPTLTIDLDLFYELILSEQPLGHRDMTHPFDIEHTYAKVEKMLADIFDRADNRKIGSLRKKVYGTANYAMGVIAYNIGQRTISRRFLFMAFFYRPELWRDWLLIGDFIKSYLDKSWINIIKKFVS